MSAALRSGPDQVGSVFFTVAPARLDWRPARPLSLTCSYCVLCVRR
jgi:hypothetical protein